MNSAKRRPRHPTLFAFPVMTHPKPSTSLRALKVCGVVSARDAELVTAVARSLLPSTVDLLIGAIAWPGSKRSVSPYTAAEIAAAAKAGGATPVAVFVDETVDQINDACKMAGFEVAQLHGRQCREAVREAGGRLAEGIGFIDVRDVAPDGTVLEEDGVGEPFWKLYDAKGGGTGKPFDWTSFDRPSGAWLLAGGLHPGNITDAVTVLRPGGVDVASGVAGEDRCKKDEAKLRLFVERLVEAFD